MKEILLVCGGGASSGFLAQKMNEAAKANGIEAHVEAIGESEIEDYIDDKELVMVGPHLKYLEDDLKEILDEYEVPFTFIPQEYYGALDGASTLQYGLDILNK